MFNILLDASPWPTRHKLLPHCVFFCFLDLIFSHHIHMYHVQTSRYMFRSVLRSNALFCQIQINSITENQCINCVGQVNNGMCLGIKYCARKPVLKSWLDHGSGKFLLLLRNLRTDSVAKPEILFCQCVRSCSECTYYTILWFIIIVQIVAHIIMAPSIFLIT